MGYTLFEERKVNSWWDMGGYGVYVWGSLGVVVIAILIEQVALHLRFKSIVDRNK